MVCLILIITDFHFTHFLFQALWDCSKNYCNNNNNNNPMWIFQNSTNCWFSLKTEWQEVSSTLQGFSQYSSPFQQCRGLDHLNSSSNFQLSQSIFNVFFLHFSKGFQLWLVLQSLSCFFFYSQARSKYWSRFLLSFTLTVWSTVMGKSTN